MWMIKLVRDISSRVRLYIFNFIKGQAHIMSSLDFNRQQMQVSAWYSTMNSCNLCQTSANFGTLAGCNALGNMGEVPEELTESLWCDITTSAAGYPF
jgi:hypothetical protein